MEITSITVTKLFGKFDHRIDFNNDEITIVIGENGLGKTAILEFVYNLFNAKYDEIKKISFELIQIEFNNGKTLYFKTNENRNLIINTKLEDDIGKWYNLNYQITTSGHSGLITLSNGNKVRFSNTPSNIRNSLFMIERELRKNEINEVEIDNILSNIYNSPKNKTKIKNLTLPDEISNILNSIKVELIETQRILTKNNSDSNEYKSTISTCAEHLKGLIADCTKESQEKTTELDGKFPNRIIGLINNGDENKISAENINERLINLNEKRNFLSRVGILTSLKIEDINNFDNIDPAILSFIKMYIDDSEVKLKPFDKVLDKLTLFLSISNSRLKYKRLLACSDNGFKVQSISPDGKMTDEYDFHSLSSGEQHLIILFFKFIFIFNNNEIVLIDEPELSLHISWQNELINDINQITQGTKNKVLIATHSPDIIGSHWGITQELKGLDVQWT
ncbi:AAA family ATPase [Vibrio cyclitrophicus]